MTHDANSIPISELREALNRAMDTLEEHCGAHAETQHDYFWSIDRSRAYDMNQTPTSDDIDVGQITESWEFLQRGKLDSDMRTPDDLVWAGEILIALGHQVAATPKKR